MPGPRESARQAAQAEFKSAGDVFFLRQVHGCAVVTPPWTVAPDADASITTRAGALLAIETADCLPVLIVDPILRRVAAAHAGWRGTVSGVVREAVSSLVGNGSNPASLLATLGPSIGPCCYEVGPEVEEAFGASGERFFVPGPRGRKHLDLAGANRAQLEHSGLVEGNIDTLDYCTGCRPDLFFSYRRERKASPLGDGANAGRMISVIGFSRTSPSEARSLA
jgi:YfiH family protein